MNNLLTEMKKRGVSKKEIKNILGCSDGTISDKLSGEIEFTVPEVIKIRRELFSDLSIDYLFG